MTKYYSLYPQTRFRHNRIAAAARLGTRTLVRKFKKVTGNTPNEYLQRVRIEAAKERLTRTGEPVSAIQYAVGYNDPKTFRTIFNRLTGMTPTYYRRAYQTR